jgi:AcrR family transcriptional regulator
MNVFDEDRPASRQARKAATSAAVLEAARDEFEARGYEEASIRAIAKRAGVSAGTVLHHFADKRELLHAALFDEIDCTVRATLASIGRDDLRGRLLHLAQGIFGAYEARPRLSRTLLRESLLAAGPWAARFQAQLADVHAAVRRFVDEAIESGELREDVDRDLVGMAYFSFFYFALMAWIQEAPLPGGPMPLVCRLLDEHWKGLAPNRPRPPSKGGVR